MSGQTLASFSLVAGDHGVSLVTNPSEGLSVQEALDLLVAVLGAVDGEPADEPGKPWGWDRP